MRVLVTFAVEAEFAPWRKLRKFRPVRVTPPNSQVSTEFWETVIGEIGACVCLTGIAGRLPLEAVSFREALYEKPADFAISSGLAGALKPENAPGDVFAAEKIGTIGSSTDLVANATLVQLAKNLGASTVSRLLTVDRIVRTKEEKALLSKDADAVDMESAVIMQGFSEMRIPAITIRAVSDGSAEDLPIDFSRCITSEGKVRSPQMIMELFSHPAAVPSLIRFGRQSKAAATRLAEFLDEFVSSMSQLVAKRPFHEVAVQ